jgi:hypothetical protein
MDGRMDGRTDGRTDGRMGGYADSGPYSPDAPRPLETGPLCTAVSVPHHLQRRSTSDNVRDLYWRKAELWTRKTDQIQPTMRLPREL